MSLSIESASDGAALDDFLALHDRVYAHRSARWPADVLLQRAVLTGRTPFATGRRFQPLVARRGGVVVARAAAVLDERYAGRFGERLGHVVLFEALPDAGDAVRPVLDAACEWLAHAGAVAARTGWWPPLDDPFVTEPYELLPPLGFRQNPPAYHDLLAVAGFAPERRWVDYCAEVTPALVRRWEAEVTAAHAAGYDLVPLARLPVERRRAHAITIFNEAFAEHWGMPLLGGPELDELTGDDVVRESSLLAFDGDEPAGLILVVPGDAGRPVLAPGRRLDPCREGTNFLSVGVRPAARRRGLGAALTARTFLTLAERGARAVGYTLVLDDNWASRRTAERLGATLSASYVAYRRELTPPR